MALLMTVAANAQQRPLAADALTHDKSAAITQPLPVPRFWLNDHEVLLEQRNTGGASSYVIYDAATGKNRVATATEAQPAAAPQSVFLKDGDVFYKDANGERQLTRTEIAEKVPTLSPDHLHAAYTRGNNLFVYNLQTNKESQLTTDGTTTILNGYASWVYMEEILGRATQYKAYWWSPDSKHIAYFRTDESMVPVFPIYDETGQHGFLENTRYPKAGDPNPEVKVGIADISTTKTVWADFNEKDDQYFGTPHWDASGSSLWVQWLNRDQNDYHLYAISLENGAKSELYREQQKTWIDLEDRVDRFNFLANNKGYVYLSDKSGWMQLYYHDMQGKLIRQLAPGEYSVLAVPRIDEKAGVVYFTARKENSTRIDLYSVKLDGGDFKRLTTGDYYNDVNVSPTGKYFVTTYSNINTPTKVALMANTGKVITNIADSKGTDYDKYEYAKTELIRVKSDDGKFDLPAVITWPLHMDSTRHYPVLISIYGGPNAGTVYDRFSVTANQQWLAKEGVIQIAMDHRASGQFGKAGVNYMYRDLGDWELKDYATIVKYLEAKGYADPKKICITGFSYGGYMSCLAVTKYAGVFNYAMAGGSVTDWSLYDSHYTERYMDTPKDNPDGYKNGAVLTFADKYNDKEGMLQIVHGTIDDNVHLQNSLQLVRKLQSLDKNFEMMFYPGGRHGWPGMARTHFENEKMRFVYRYLLEKPVVAEMIH